MTSASPTQDTHTRKAKAIRSHVVLPAIVPIPWSGGACLFSRQRQQQHALTCRRICLYHPSLPSAHHWNAGPDDNLCHPLDRLHSRNSSTLSYRVLLNTCESRSGFGLVLVHVWASELDPRVMQVVTAWVKWGTRGPSTLSVTTGG